MKSKLSITIDDEKLNVMNELLEEGFFRSKSHILEYTLTKFLKENNGKTLKWKTENYMMKFSKP